MASELPTDLKRDVEAISRLAAIPTILRVIAETTGLRFTLVARVTSDRWVACAVHDEIAFGLEAGGTLELSTTLCETVRDTKQPVMMDHASTDPVYCNHPTPKMYGFESYISWPLFDRNGEYFGTLCGLDPKPALVKQPKVTEMFKHFSELISLQLVAEDRLQTANAQLLDAQQTAQLREQFVAVLSHDLRNPLSSMKMAGEILLSQSLDEPSRKTVERMRRSVDRMSELVTDLLDFARAKLGAGIGVDMVDGADLASTLRHVVAELKSAHPKRDVAVAIEPLGTIRCDATRLGQLLSNLVSNAITHGPPGGLVDVRVGRVDGALVFAVHNEGLPIPSAVQARLFEPYTQGGPGSPKGLGLGLYIVKQIADAHHATVTVHSDETSGTRFTFEMPLTPG